ncbi:CRAL-TRIO domain-containing protein [Phakopsora pachyrhizi]|uniref:CRAL-TRIO domain-containing protein n=1 Tax=Phakopsora pachyrhizi TaxID=170000 RepID=A0AAV0BD01_PHAPC|nr:CRAL-TRIO domain-containing protein [Phakopsora pachyrhizi]CAH7683100.1 CRAL-TRIO domain-containing protein [Phakopsora pachyrhizi]
MSASNPEPLISRYNCYLDSFNRHLPDILVLHHRSLNELLPSLLQHSSSSSSAQLISDVSTLQLVSDFLNDKLSLYRFLRKSRYSIDLALSSLEKSIHWRLSSNIDFISQSSIDPIYLDQPLLFFHPQLSDRWSRPLGVLNLKHLRRSDDGSLDGLKEFIAWNMEIARRFIYHSSLNHLNQILEPSTLSSSSSSQQLSSTTSSLIIQFVLLIDLKDASMSNLEVELLPYLMDLLKNNFPGMVGAIFILNYGWMYAGMWQLAKRILPQQTLDRIFFPTQKDLEKFFEKSNLLVEHGGEFVYDFHAQQNHFIRRYGTATQSISSTPADQEIDRISRKTSMESLHDVFYSAANTPYQLFTPQPGTPSRTLGSSHLPRPSWLSMTAFNSDSISPSELGQAMRNNQLRNSGRIWPLTDDFQLRLPSDSVRTVNNSNHLTDDEDESASQTSTALAVASPSSSASSSSSSLHEAILSLADDDDQQSVRQLEWSSSTSTRRISSSRHCRDSSNEVRVTSPKYFKRAGILPNLPRDQQVTQRRRKRDYWYRLILRIENIRFKLQMMFRLMFSLMRVFERRKGESNHLVRALFGIGILLSVLIGRKRIGGMRIQRSFKSNMSGKIH